MASTSAQDAMRKRMFGHGSLMILSSLIGGLGLWCFLLGGFELLPGHILEFQLPGSAAGWVRCHTGPVANGFMVILTGMGLPYLELPDSTAEWLGWIVMMDGWSNVGFYFFGNLSPNRALAFGESRLGPANIFSFLALGPAYLFGVLAMGAFAKIGYHALAGGEVTKTNKMVNGKA
jgi:hypothetical protein